MQKRARHDTVTDARKTHEHGRTRPALVHRCACQPAVATSAGPDAAQRSARLFLAKILSHLLKGGARATVERWPAAGDGLACVAVTHHQHVLTASLRFLHMRTADLVTINLLKQAGTGAQRRHRLRWRAWQAGANDAQDHALVRAHRSDQRQCGKMASMGGGPRDF